MRSALRTLRWLAGPSIWAAYFLAVYASESLICSRGAGAQVHFMFVAAATVPALGAILWMLAFGARSRRDVRFLDAIGAGLAGLSLIATAWTALAAIMLPACR
jgi:hypothetical protein